MDQGLRGYPAQDMLIRATRGRCKQSNHGAEEDMACQEISDAVWSKVEPLLVPFRRKKSGGSPAVDFRRLLNGMFYLLKTGCQSAVPGVLIYKDFFRIIRVTLARNILKNHSHKNKRAGIAAYAAKARAKAAVWKSMS